MKVMNEHPLLFNLVVLLCYSVFYLVVGGKVDVNGLHWATLISHSVILYIVGGIALGRDERRGYGLQLILSGTMVLLVGHGLCFFNGLLNFNMH